MHVIVTTCTAEKRPDRGVLPAGVRYLGARIDHARQCARQQGRPLFIFSGVYGLLAESDPVVWYDHALQPEEVASAAQDLAASLMKAGVRQITAIVEARDAPGWAPYHDVLEQGSRSAGVTVQVELWTEPRPVGADADLD